MDFETNLNLTINKVLSKQGVTAMIIAKDGSGKGPFLTNLATYYKNVFWFSPQIDDFGNLVLCVAKRLYADDSEKLNEILQVLYCKNRFNNEDVIINHMLDCISHDKNNYLFVFEEMDTLDEKFDYSQIERMIKLCPQNLKIVLSSEKFIPLNFSCFEGRWPIIIDEEVIKDTCDKNSVTVYMHMVENDEKIFLKTIVSLRVINLEFTETFFPGAGKILGALAAYPSLLAKRNDGIYKMTSGFKSYIQNELQVEPSLSPDQIKKLYIDFALGKKDYTQALKTAYELKNKDLFNKILNVFFHEKTSVATMSKFARYYPPFDDDLDVEYYPYAGIFLALHFFYTGEKDKSLRLLEKAQTVLSERDPAYNVAISMQMYILYKQKKYTEEYALYEKYLDYIKSEPLTEIDDIISTTFKSMIEADLPINMSVVAKYEKAFEEKKDEIYYVKMRELFSRTYAHIGNYKKAIEIVEDLHKTIPFYTIPHNTVSLRFFGIDSIDTVEEEIDRALKNAEEKDILTDKSLLYSAKARISEYFGKTEEAISLYEKAVATPYSSNRAKFQNVADLTVAYARYKNLEYAKEYATVYLKYAETYYPTYAYLMHYALSYCYLLEGEMKAANDHAMECIKSSKSKSRYWLLSMAVTANELIKKNAMGNPVEFVEKLLKTAENFGMDMMIVENYDIFETIVNYAINNGIRPDYTDKIVKAISRKEQSKVKDGNVLISLVGAPRVTVNNVEISWKTKKAKELFIQYVLAGKEGLERNYIINLMWKDYQYDSAINNLKTTNNILRKTLEGAGVDFKLDYINSKYVLTIKDCVIDTVRLKELLEDGIQETNLRKKEVILDKVLAEYKGEIGPDLDYPQIRDIARDITHAKTILLMRVIKGLIKENECMDARKYLNILIEIDHEGDYQGLMNEINYRLGGI